jgi:hypothetical protein
MTEAARTSKSEQTPETFLPPLRPEYEHLARLYGSVSQEEFWESYGPDTPLNPDGTIDYRSLVTLVSSMVPDGYRWKAPFFDEDHLYRPRGAYMPLENNGDTLAAEFRDLPVNKLWVPRQWHEVKDRITKPPTMPSREVMQEQISDFRRHKYIYSLADAAIRTGDVGSEDMRELPMSGWVVDMRRRRTYDPEAFERGRKKLVARIEDDFADGLPPDLESLTILRLVEDRRIDLREALPKIRRHLGRVSCCRRRKVRGRHNKRTTTAARPVPVPVELAA